MNKNTGLETIRIDILDIIILEVWAWSPTVPNYKAIFFFFSNGQTMGNSVASTPPILPK